MKLITAISIIIAIILFSRTTFYDLEGDNYVIIEKIENIEIREYKDLIYAAYTPKNVTDRDNSFRNVAGYIFGNNTKKEKIDMTSPVVIRLHNKNEMAFIMPEEYSINNLPKPGNEEVKIYTEPSNTKACIRYSGYSNSKVENKKIQKLKEILKKHNIKHKDDFEVLVYNSPYQFINRKNEISVSVEYKNKKMNTSNNKESRSIYLGGGCFWCIEAVFEGVNGVNNVVSGYSGGKIKNPSYKEVSSGRTQHAEVCKIDYDPEKIKIENLLEIFFLSHDPTTLNRQGNDIGKHYRSIILYKSDNEKNIIQQYIDSINKSLFNNRIVTEIKIFEKFYKAENYHQNYYKLNESAPYCTAVISPKLIKAKKELSKYYK